MTRSYLFSHPLFVVFGIQIILAYEWLTAGWEKISGGQFVSSIGKTLNHFEQGNPHAWYIHSILETAKNHPVLFGILVQWGELFVGLGLIGAILVHSFKWQKIARILALISLLGGILMNVNFFFAAGWSSPSTGGLNMLMFWSEVVLWASWFSRETPLSKR